MVKPNSAPISPTPAAAPPAAAPQAAALVAAASVAAAPVASASSAVTAAASDTRTATKAAADVPKVASRVADASQAAFLFSTHTWHVEPPPLPPPPPAPPPVPTAPAFPYTLLGAVTPEGARSVYFLSRGDRVIDAHVGDRLDGIYQFESADGNQLVFNYLPLNIRQSISVAGTP
jgi:hypothetical protein